MEKLLCIVLTRHELPFNIIKEMIRWDTVYANLFKGSGTPLETKAPAREILAEDQCCANQVCSACNDTTILTTQLCVWYNESYGNLFVCFLSQM